MFLLDKALFKEESKEMTISLFVVFHNKSNCIVCTYCPNSDWGVKTHKGTKIL